MDLKDVLTPLVTLAGVWLAARFTLRNEVQKKALEIRTARLESIAADCSDSLTGIRNYVGSSLHLIHKVLYYRQIKKLSIRETADATGYSTSQVCRIQALYKENESS